MTIVALPFKPVLDEKILSLLEKISKRNGTKALLINKRVPSQNKQNNKLRA